MSLLTRVVMKDARALLGRHDHGVEHVDRCRRGRSCRRAMVLTRSVAGSKPHEASGAVSRSAPDTSAKERLSCMAACYRADVAGGSLQHVRTPHWRRPTWAPATSSPARTRAVTTTVAHSSLAAPIRRAMRRGRWRRPFSLSRTRPGSETRTWTQTPERGGERRDRDLGRRVVTVAREAAVRQERGVERVRRRPRHPREEAAAEQHVAQQPDRQRGEVAEPGPHAVRDRQGYDEQRPHRDGEGRRRRGRGGPARPACPAARSRRRAGGRPGRWSTRASPAPRARSAAPSRRRPWMRPLSAAAPARANALASASRGWAARRSSSGPKRPNRPAAPSSAGGEAGAAPVGPPGVGRPWQRSREPARRRARRRTRRRAAAGSAGAWAGCSGPCPAVSPTRRPAARRLAAWGGQIGRATALRRRRRTTRTAILSSPDCRPDLHKRVRSPSGAVL